MSSTVQRTLKRSDPNTIQDKFLVGYQGWFTCGGDGEPVGPGHHGWLHWFDSPLPAGGRPNTDLWPDVSSYSPSELYPAPGLKSRTGEQLFLFSSRNAKTVQRHFHWMAEYGVDGAFLQRFANETDIEAGSEGIRRIRDEVCDRVREAAEKEDRVFALMYDVSGAPADRIGRILERDWVHLVRVKGILDSPNYLHEKGRPVVGLWGFGFNEAGHSPSLLRDIITSFRNVTPGGAYIMAGVPAYWRTSEGDADRNPEFLTVWLNEVDAISPWTIGRYSSEHEADLFAENRMKGDSELLKKRAHEGFRKVDYVPVVFPGGSGYNLSQGNWEWNGIKRDGGRFLWKQIYNAQKLGVRTMYGAMWDEYDEGTVFIPVVTHQRLLPVSDEFRFMALDEDGYDLPADWYMRISGFAAEALRGERRVFETFPFKDLQDYWSCRPKYEELSDSATPKKPASQSYEEPSASRNDGKEEAPPPPYSLLEAEEGPTCAGIARSSSSSLSSSTNDIAQPTSPTMNLPPPQHPSRVPRVSDTVSSLTNEMGRVAISTGRLPPPVPNMSTRPSPRPQVNLATRPVNAPSSIGPSSGPLFPTPHVQEANTSPGPWSQEPWPPAEWKFNDKYHHHSTQPPLATSYAVYKPTGGANLNRPHTVSYGRCQSHNPPGGSGNLRPSMSVGARPNVGTGASSCSGSKDSGSTGFPSGSHSTSSGHDIPASMYPGQQTLYRPPPQSAGYEYPALSTCSDAAGHHAEYHHIPPSQPPSFPQLSGPLISGPGGGYYQGNPGPWVPAMASGNVSPQGGSSGTSSFGFGIPAVAGKKAREQIEAVGSRLFGRLK